MDINEINEFEDAMFEGGWSKLVINYPDGTVGVVYASPRGLEAVKKSDGNFIVLDKKDWGAY